MEIRQREREGSTDGRRERGEGREEERKGVGVTRQLEREERLILYDGRHDAVYEGLGKKT